MSIVYQSTTHHYSYFYLFCNYIGCNKMTQDLITYRYTTTIDLSSKQRGIKGHEKYWQEGKCIIQVHIPQRPIRSY